MSTLLTRAGLSSSLTTCHRPTATSSPGKSSTSDYSVTEFLAEFPDDAACLDYLWRTRHAPDGEHAHCPKCGDVKVFKRYATKQQRQSWTCTACGHHLHPTAGTIFHRSSTSLRTSKGSSIVILKPANVKVRADGMVKVLDFGLAKAASPTSSNLHASMAPTLSLHATMTGILLGTATYMSPEQASGKPVDKRADVWSFGVVLWEMLTGQRLFEGETITHILADVLRADIDFDRLPSDSPPAMRELLRRCLDRNANNRLRDIGEARFQIEKTLSGRVEDKTAPNVSATPSVAPPRLWWRRAMSVAIAAILVGAIIGAASGTPNRLPPSL